MPAPRRATTALGLCMIMAASATTGCVVSPNEFTGSQLGAIADDKLQRVTANQEPIGGTIDLYEAMARALKYNLDHQVEIAEQAVRARELDLAHFSLLPNVVANSGYAARSNFHASNSRNILTGAESLATSTSQDKAIRTADIGFSWNILDFGLSYVRARQSADKVLIQGELRRKVALRILEDVRTAYWRAASAQRLLGRAAHVEAQAHEVEAEARSLYSAQQTSPITALTYEREVVEIQRTLGELQRELNTAMTQLGALMNVAPGTKFRVAAGSRTPGAPRAGGNIADLIHTAIENRPELREVEYRKRINEHEAHAALIELLPGVHLLAGNNFDSNSFLFNSHWVNWGAKASWNLIRVFSYPARRGVIEQQDELLDKKSLAVTMAIMTQVYVSRAKYAHALKEHRIAAKYRNVQTKLLEQIRAEAAGGRVAKQTLVREELNAVVADVKLDMAHAVAESAYANLQASIGLDPNGAEDSVGLTVAQLAAALRSGPKPHAHH